MVCLLLSIFICLILYIGSFDSSFCIDLIRFMLGIFYLLSPYLTKSFWWLETFSSGHFLLSPHTGAILLFFSDLTNVMHTIDPRAFNNLRIPCSSPMKHLMYRSEINVQLNYYSYPLNYINSISYKVPDVINEF